MSKLARKSIRTNVSKYLNENMLRNWNKLNQIVVRKLITTPSNITLVTCNSVLFYHIQLYNYIFNYWTIVLLFLPDFLSFIQENYGRFCWDTEISVQQQSQTCWSVFRARKVLSFIYSVALPWSSMSHFHCWCWCHFSNASMGTGICMTPPPPPLTTNSSFNTSAKCPVRHTVFKLVPFSLFMLNNETFVMKHIKPSVKQISLLVRISLIRYVSCKGTAVKTYTLWNGNDCQALFISNAIYFMVHLMQASKGREEVQLGQSEANEAKRPIQCWSIDILNWRRSQKR